MNEYLLISLWLLMAFSVGYTIGHLIGYFDAALTFSMAEIISEEVLNKTVENTSNIIEIQINN